MASTQQHGDGWGMIHKAAHKVEYSILKAELERNPDSINDVDKYGNNALHILIKCGNKDSPRFKDCVELLMEKGIDVKQTNFKNKSAMECARDHNIDSQIIHIMERQILPPRSSSENNTIEQILMGYLKRGAVAQEEFINYNNGDIRTWVTGNCEKSHLMLRMCCLKGLSKAVIHLLDNGADHEKTCEAIRIAAQQGNKEIFKALLDKITKIPKALLPTIVKYIDSKQHDHIGCYKVFMEKMKKWIKEKPDYVAYILNQGDEKGYTALHYAVHYAKSDVIEELLSFGASLGARTNKEGVMPINNINVDILKNHLDKCIEFNLEKIYEGKKNLEVKINYRTLIPPYVQIHEENNTEQVPFIENKVSYKQVAETEILHFMSEKSEFQELLRHPTITSYLYLKWLQIRRIFWIYFLFYMFFAIFLLGYIYIDFMTDKSTLWSMVAQTLHIILSIGVVIIYFIELFQIIGAAKNYITNTENFIGFFLAVLSTPIVLDIYPLISKNERYALTILLLSFKLVFVLGHLPNLSTNVVMFRTVSYTFYKYLILFFIPIMAFAVSLYLVFADNINDANASNLYDKKPFALHLWDSVFKTVIMITGEFNSSDLNFVTYPITSKLIFTVFVYTIAIILLNLLNGLAVNDTQKIQSDAELVGYAAQIKFFAGIETMLLGRRIFTATYAQKVFDTINPLRSTDYSCGKFLLRQSFIFPDGYNYEISEEIPLYPSIHYSGIYLDYDAIQRTNKIIQDKINEERQNKINKEIENKKNTKKQEIEMHFNRIDEKIDRILTSLASLQI